MKKIPKSYNFCDQIHSPWSGEQGCSMLSGSILPIPSLNRG